MKNVLVFLILAVLCIFTLSSFLAAEEDDVEKSYPDSETVFSLIEYGRESKSPVILLAAAEIMFDYPVIEIEVKEEAETHSSSSLQIPEELLEEAKIMSGNDCHIIAMAEEIMERLEKDIPADKKVYGHGNLEYNGEISYFIDFQEHESYDIFLTSDNNYCSLNLCDKNGTVLNSSEGRIIYTAEYSGYYILTVKNERTFDKVNYKLKINLM